MEQALEPLFGDIATGLETLGIVAMVVGIVIAFVLGLKVLLDHKGGHEAFTTLRVTLGGAILLGLEILVAADLVRTITSKPSLEDALILGVIVLIRVILSISIQIEIEGTLPWKRAMLTSGAQVVTQQVKKAVASPDTAGSETGGSASFKGQAAEAQD